MVSNIEPFYADLGRLIRDHRKKLGISQEKLSLALTPPMTRVSIANIEAGNQRVLAHTLVALAAALKTDIVDILPKKTAVDMPVDSAKIAAELASKLGITETRAKKLFGEKVKTSDHRK